MSLVQWREVTEIEFPGRLDVLKLIPIPGSVDTVKIGSNGATMSDTCNSAPPQKYMVEWATKEMSKF
eukprot:3810677-Ditylum_brightwellii.AAC.1